MKLRKISIVLGRLYIFFEYMVDVCFYRLFGIGEMEEEPVAGKVAIITGANTGLGKQIVKELADRGATVILACRNLSAGKQALEEIHVATTLSKLELMHLDLSDLNSVRKFASDVKSRYPEIHLLINNAGVCSYKNELQTLKNGFELHMGVNHLGHFLLTNLLLDNIKAAAPSRIVSVGSSTVLASHMRLDDLMMERFRDPTTFTGMTRLPYNNSKLANALFTYELGKRLEGSGVSTYSVCPGIVKTNIFRDAQDMDRAIVKVVEAIYGLSVEAATPGVLYCALSRKCDHETGKIYRFGSSFRKGCRMLNPRDAERLWRLSEDLVHMK